MKQKSTFIFLLGFVFALFFHFSAAAQSDSCRIEVFANGLTPGKIKLIGVMGDQNFIIDSSVVDANGHFILARKQPLPAGYYYFLLPNGKNFAILMDETEQFFTLHTDVKDFVSNMRADGCLNTDLLYQNFKYQMGQESEFAAVAAAMRNIDKNSDSWKAAKSRQDELLADRQKHLQAIYDKYPTSLFVKFKVAGQNPEYLEFRKANGDLDTARQVAYYRGHFWDGVDFEDARLLRTPVISNKLKRYMKELTPQNPDSIIAVADPLIRQVMPYKPYFQFFVNWIALQYENTKTTVMDGEAAYVHIINNFFTPELATWDTPENIAALRKHAWEMEASLMGRKGPDVTAQNQYGYEKSIYESKADVVVVMLFSPDCEHCQKDAAAIEATYQKWKDKGVDFYGIAVNTNDGEWRMFLEKHKFSFTNVFDPTNRAIYAKYYVDITPELYILNKDRIIVAKNLHVEQLEPVFEKELRKLGKL